MFEFEHILDEAFVGFRIRCDVLSQMRMRDIPCFASVATA
jgi:hypothetical protein